MRQAHFVKSFVFLFLFLASAGFAAAQVSIGAVVNAGSRIQSTWIFMKFEMTKEIQQCEF
jgi:hypothetical protein